MTSRWLLSLGVSLLLAGAPAFAADEKPKVAAPKPNSADEPVAKEFSLAKGAEFLDAASIHWTRERKCGTCHTNYPYMMSRAVLKDTPKDGVAEVRKFFEERIKSWDEKKPRNPTEVVATATVLAFNDAQTTGKLDPLTRKAFDRMWTVQQADGAWNWVKCKWPPFEHDDYYGAVFGALGVGIAPEKYAETDNAKKGLEKLKNYFEKTPPPNLHHKAWLAWASLKVDGLMKKEDRESTMKDLLALQREDGGWSLASLADWKGNDGRENDPKAPSDGYATGFAVYLLRQTGMATKEKPIQKGLQWLKSNQRESGRWFTRSLNTDKHHYISHAGTAFAVMAIQACE